MKVQRIQSTAKPVVNGQRSGYDRAVRLIGWQGTERGCILKEQRDIGNLPNENIIRDCMGIVEMKGVAKMIGIDK